MKLRIAFSTALCLGAAAFLLSGCGKDFNGFGETQGWGGYTKGFGDVDEGMDKPVGLCSYTGGCMTDENSPAATKSASDSGAHAADHSVDDSGSH